MMRWMGTLTATAALLVAAACTEAPAGREAGEQAYQQLRDRYMEAESAEEKAVLAREFLEECPESEHTPTIAGAYMYYHGNELGAHGEAYDFVAYVRDRVEDPQIRFELGMQLVDAAKEAGREIDIETVVAELADHRDLSYTENVSVVNAATDLERWSLLIQYADAALEQATPDVYIADYPEREVTPEEAAQRARRRQALVLAPLGWAEYKLGRIDEAVSTFNNAEAVTGTNYVGVPESSLYSYWGRMVLAEGNAERALDLLAPDAIIGGDEVAKAALREAYLAVRGDDGAFEQWMWSERKRLARTVDDFTLPTYDGGEFSLSSMGDKVVLLTFWFPT